MYEKAEDARKHAVSRLEAESRFFANMNHELRTPLNVVVGTAELMRNRGTVMTDQELREFLDTITFASESLLRLINDILLLSSITSKGSLTVNLAPTYVPDLLHDTMRSLSLLASKKNISLALCAPPCLPVCRTDPSRVQQLIVNLVTNAIKYSRGGTRDANPNNDNDDNNDDGKSSSSGASSLKQKRQQMDSVVVRCQVVSGAERRLRLATELKDAHDGSAQPAWEHEQEEANTRNGANVTEDGEDMLQEGTDSASSTTASTSNTHCDPLIHPDGQQSPAPQTRKKQNKRKSSGSCDGDGTTLVEDEINDGEPQSPATPQVDQEESDADDGDAASGNSDQTAGEDDELKDLNAAADVTEEQAESVLNEPRPEPEVEFDTAGRSGDSTQTEEEANSLNEDEEEATDEGKSQAISNSEAVDPNPEDEESWLEIRVQDTGIGIPEQKIKSIFGRFLRDDSDFVREQEGCGLGLAICSEIIRSLKGSIHVTSKPAVGSMFIVYVPFVTPTTPPAAADLPSACCTTITQAKIGVIAVDECDNTRRVLGDSMEVAGVAHCTCSGVDEALAAVHSWPHKVPCTHVLIDTQTVLISDKTQLDTLHRECLTRGIKVVRMDSLDRLTARDASSRTPFDVEVSKPLRLNQLILGQTTHVPASPSEQTTNDDLGHPLILVVEDNPMNTKIACKILASIGCDTLQAQNGLIAVSTMFAEHPKPIACVLMDLNMPVLDGLQATAQIRARGSCVPIIACTAHVVDDVREKCLSVGMNHVLQKPLRISDIREVLRKFIRS
eukprot:c20651_g2_i2.p1 GENE.c20651_g2_i2~~c20651_g2_i2.p1  ORF type:complete len:882 (+),score=188.77 c20651_g2_i2:292-2646(+)